MCTQPDDRRLAALLESVKAGDSAALARLYDLTCDWVFLAAKRIVRDPQWAEEVALDVYLYVWQRPERFDPERGTVPVWLMTLTRSRSLDRLRVAAARARTEEAARERETLNGQAVDERPALEVRDVLRAALAQLPPEQREPLELAYFPGLTHVEISERLDVPLGTVKSRIRLALNKLRAVLAEEENR